MSVRTSARLSVDLPADPPAAPDSDSAPGRVVAVRGSVIDIRFPETALPPLFDAVEILWDGPERLVAEVQSHLDAATVRAIALQGTSGLRRGTPARSTGGPLTAPVGEAVLGRLPSRVGYQPTLASEIAELEERVASTPGAVVTAIQAVYVPADDFTDPAVAELFSHLDSSIVLSRAMAAEGLYPAVDPLSSTSSLLEPLVVGEAHYRLAEDVRKTIAHYRELQDVIALLGMEELSAADRLAVRRARRLQRFLTQPFLVTEAFTGHGGVSVPLEETLRGCRAILDGEGDDWSESAFFMTGTLDQVRDRDRAGRGA